MAELAPLGPAALRQHVDSSSARASTSSRAETPSTSGSGDRGIGDGSQRVTNGFIYHKVSKLDTLAGLAIKYGVTVSDIKRANGILWDNAMFAREHVKVPTSAMPMSEEAQVLLARLMSGYGRDASLNASERRAPGTVSMCTQLPGSPTSRSSYPEGSEAVDDELPGTPYSRRSDKSSSEPGDVELMERTIGSNGDGPHSGYGSDRVRRRTKNDSSSNNSSSGSRYAHSTQQLSQAAEAAVGWLSHAAAGAAAAAQAALPAAATSLTSSCLAPAARRSFNNAAFGDSSWTDQLACAISHGSSSLVQKIKRAASQPALASDGADAALRSANGGPQQLHSPGLLRGGGGSSRRDDAGGGSSSSSIDLLARGTGMLPPPRKDTKGD